MMTSFISIKINSIPLEVEIESTPAEPENGIQGGYDIIAVYVSRTIKEEHPYGRVLVDIQFDIWPIICDYMEQDIVEKIEALRRDVL
jgi:hypothetical protein